MKRLVLYAHYDEFDKIEDYVVHALRSLHDISDTIIFISTSPLPDSELAKITPYISTSLLIDNVGFDFFMWKLGLSQVKPTEYDEIVLSNSSVYGPLWDISAVFNKMAPVPCDFWGITENYELEWHLQSYFIVFRREALRSQAFERFWDSVLPYSNKNQVIRSYEIGLSQWLIGHGLKASAFCSWKKVARLLISLKQAKHNKPINPSVAHAGEIISLGVPFLKLEVVRDNPFNADINQIVSFLKNAGYPVENLSFNAPKRSRGIKSEPKGTCPLCGLAGEIQHTKVTDCFEFNSSTRWPVRRCTSSACGCVWLDPCPLENEIYKAYQNYYTHEGVLDACNYHLAQLSSSSKLTLQLFRKALKLTGIHKKRRKYWLHHLERGNGRLLEIGCGDGSRLAALRELGWRVEGQEIDPKAVQHCLTKGLQVHEGSLESLTIEEGSFDIILMSHVLEHVHRPKEFLKICFRLLKPGGRLVLSTPNANSLGHKIYRHYWRPLEAPRHIIVYTPRAISNLLQESGFTRFSVNTIPLNFELISMHSRDIRFLGWTDANSMPRVGNEPIPVAMQFLAMLLHPLLPERGEECFAIAERPT